MNTNEYTHRVKNDNWQPFNQRLWQRNYYERIIRTESGLNKIRIYIKNNPSTWDQDKNKPLIV